MRSICVGVISVVLLAGSAIGVAGQSEDEPPPFTAVTGAAVEMDIHLDDVEEWEEDGVIYGRNHVVEFDMQWSDPRLPAKHWVRFGFTLLEPDSPRENTVVVTTSHLLVGADGGWRGTGRAVEDLDGRFSQYVLTGEGEYEGLYALLQGTLGSDRHGPLDESYEGFIFEGELPVFPDTPVPVTTEGMQVFPFPTEAAD